MTLAIATDGSGRKDGRAGYGVTARWLARGEDASLPPAPGAEPTLTEHYGPVDTDPKSHMWLGAAKATNNTGELTAMHVALRTAEAHAVRGDFVRILPDSMMAICTTTGAWKSPRHRTLVSRNVGMLATLRTRGVRVQFSHIRAHRGHTMNERADSLADLGAQTTTHFSQGRTPAPATGHIPVHFDATPPSDSPYTTPGQRARLILAVDRWAEYIPRGRTTSTFC